MGAIERRVEATPWLPDYSGHEFTEDEIAAGAHRDFIGGGWDTHGIRQLEFLRGRGLRPEHTFLDVGCGCLRAGRLFVDTLNPRNYYGVDANLSLLHAGYDVELTDDQRRRLPAGNLRATDRFAVDFGVPFDFALAQSVFTHVSLNHIRLCLYRVAQVMQPGGVFYATFFERPRKTPIDAIFGTERQKPHFTEQNVFWYYRGDMRWAAGFSPWRMRYIGEWGHPVHQMMLEFTRVAEIETATTAVKTPDGRLQRARRWAAQRLAPD